MPELAEVEFYRKQWNPGLSRKVLKVHTQRRSRNFRECAVEQLEKSLAGAMLLSSETHGKQMLFRFSGDRYLGVHLGMTGKLLSVPSPYARAKWDHLVLEQAKQVLIFSDPRQFGKILFFEGDSEPSWWSERPPSLLSDQFHREALAAFLKRRKKSVIKAVLLMQECFPGLGNWMVDEILWRAEIHPAQRAGELTEEQVSALYRIIREVCQQALEVIGNDWSTPPDSWLFNHRWRDGGYCPKTGVALVRETLGGRTTCWSPGRQQLGQET